jgi:hypothetical protein
MIIYPVEFQRRLEQKWGRRIDQIIAVTGSATPPRDPNDDDDYEDEGANHLPPTPSSPPGKSSRPKKTSPRLGQASAAYRVLSRLIVE